MVKLVSIDTTPNPNSMKLNLSDAMGASGTFTRANQASAPELVKQLLAIEGVTSLFSTATFLTLNRDPRIDWQPILDAAQQVFSGQNPPQVAGEAQRQTAGPEGQVTVLVQTFRQIPLQVKVTDGLREERLGLPPRFGETARELQNRLGGDYLKERHWADWGIRYGTLAEVAKDVAEEIESLLDEAQLQQRKRLALGEVPEPAMAPSTRGESKDLSLDSPDWQERFQAIQQLEASEENLPPLIWALQDEKPQIRRWAAAKLAGVKATKSVEALSQALLNDSNVGVRRTAGDSLSDIGDIAAQEAMCQALFDQNKLVRWRAARFLAETGTQAALPYLKKAENDPEYEVRLEIEAAMNHITAGSKAALPVWKLMSQDQ